MTAPGAAEPAPTKPFFGIDAPYVPVLLGLSGGMLFAAGLASQNLGPLISGGFLLLSALIYLHTTLRGKFVVWDGLLDALALRGDEDIADLGCGRGAVLLAAATRIPRGQAVGVDLWRTRDQSGNAEEVTRRNAETMGVSERVDLKTADLSKLPFGNAMFDVVLSSIAIHNITTDGGRERAIDEAYRILRPGGRLVIADIRDVKKYAARLTELGATDVEVRGAGPQYWFGGPYQAIKIVTATRPAST